jgi:hypothetical protein
MEIAACLIALRVSLSFPLIMFRGLTEFHGTRHETHDTEDHIIYFLNFPGIINNNNLFVRRTTDFNMILITLDALMTFY